MTTKIILNPYAGRWKGREKRPDVESTMKSAGIEYDLVVTDAPNHGTDLAYQAVKAGYSPIVSAGGDGSVSEVMNGIVAAAQELGVTPPPLGVLPLGSATDLLVNLGLPINIPEAVKVIAAGQTRRIDLGAVTAWDIQGKNPKKRYFDNNSAIGLEPCITLVQQRISWLRGSLRYVVATLLGVLQNPQWKMHIEWEGGSYDGPATLVTAGNNPLTGGVFYMAPHADPFDGKLSCVFGSIPSRLKILQVLPRTMKAGPGNYVEHPAIKEINVSWLKIHTDKPTPLHADGEIQFEQTQDIEYQVLPDYLPILMHGDAKASE
ncbi:MAG: diacylglycerol kinase family lipid kinase [Anaerolineae bacterium]|nr:diacylglycerol kinase family lipid kinase [Anaerolineae bacterium]